MIQTGYSDYEPKNCNWDKFFSYQDMKRYTSQARIVITHGGPSSFMMPLGMGKIPIVVPRQHQFGEHVNNHQLDFCRTAKSRCNFILVENMDELGNIIAHYKEIVSKSDQTLKSHTQEFTEKFTAVITQLMEN